MAKRQSDPFLLNGETLNSLYILEFRLYQDRIHQIKIFVNGSLSYTQDTNITLTYTITVHIYQNEMRWMGLKDKRV